MFVFSASAFSKPCCSSGTAISADLLNKASSAIFSSVWISLASLACEALEKSWSGSLLKSVCSSFMNFARSSSVAASFLSNCSSLSEKFSTGFLARFSEASTTFFCCSSSLSSFFLSSWNFFFSSSGRLPPGCFFISERISDSALRVASRIFSRVSTIRSWSLLSLGTDWAKAGICWSFTSPSHCCTASSISLKANWLSTRLMAARSSASLAGMVLARSMDDFWISVCDRRTTSAEAAALAASFSKGIFTVWFRAANCISRILRIAARRPSSCSRVAAAFFSSATMRIEAQPLAVCWGLRSRPQSEMSRVSQATARTSTVSPSLILPAGSSRRCCSRAVVLPSKVVHSWTVDKGMTSAWSSGDSALAGAGYSSRSA